MPHADFDVLFVPPVLFPSPRCTLAIKLTPEYVRLARAYAVACVRTAERHGQVFHKVRVAANGHVIRLPPADAPVHVRRVVPGVTWPYFPQRPERPCDAYLSETTMSWRVGSAVSQAISYDNLDKFLTQATLGLGTGRRINSVEWAKLVATAQ